MKSSQSGKLPLMTGNSMLHAASMTASTTLFATFAAKPTRPPALGFGNLLHLSVGSVSFAKIMARLSSSSSFCFTFLVGTAARLVISGMNRSVPETILSSQVGVGPRQLVSAGQRRNWPSGVVVGVWEKNDGGRPGALVVVVDVGV